MSILDELIQGYSNTEKHLSKGQKQQAKQTLSYLSTKITGLNHHTLLVTEQDRVFLLIEKIMTLCKGAGLGIDGASQLLRTCQTWQSRCNIKRHQIYWRLGKTVEQQNKPHEAERHYKTSIQAVYQHGHDAWKDHHVDVALDHYEQALYLMTEFLAPPFLTEENLAWASRHYNTLAIPTEENHPLRRIKSTLRGLLNVASEAITGRERYYMARLDFQSSAAFSSNKYITFLSHLVNLQKTPPAPYQLILYREAITALFVDYTLKDISPIQPWMLAGTVAKNGDSIRAQILRDVAFRLVSSFEALPLNRADKKEFMFEYVQWIKTLFAYDDDLYVFDRWLLLPIAYQSSVTDQEFFTLLNRLDVPKLVPIQKLDSVIVSQPLKKASPIDHQQIMESKKLAQDAAHEKRLTELARIRDVRHNPRSTKKLIEDALESCNNLLPFYVKNAQVTAKILLERGNLQCILTQRTYEFKGNSLDYMAFIEQTNAMHFNTMQDLGDALQHEPDSFEILSSLGQLSLLIGKIYQTNHKHQHALLGGKIRENNELFEEMMQNYFQTAFNYFTQAITIKPMDPETLWEIAFLHIHFSQYPQANDVLTTYTNLTHAPKKTMARHTQAMLRLIEEKYEAALTEFRAIREECRLVPILDENTPSQFSLFLNEGIAASHSSHHEEALKCFNQALSQIPTALCNTSVSFDLLLVFPSSKMTNAKIMFELKKMNLPNHETVPIIIKNGKRFIFYETINDLNRTNGIDLDDIHQLLSEGGIIVTPGLVINIKGMNTELYQLIREKCGVEYRLNGWEQIAHNAVQKHISILQTYMLFNNQISQTGIDELLYQVRKIRQTSASTNKDLMKGVTACNNLLKAPSLNPAHGPLILIERGMLNIRLTRQMYDLQKQDATYVDAAVYQNAITDFQTALSEQPDLFDALFLLGYTHSLTGRMFQAAHENNLILSKKEHSQELDELIRTKKKFYTDACKYYSQAIQIKPDHIDARWHLAINQDYLEEYAAAEEHYIHIVKTETVTETVLYARINLIEYQAKRDLPGALAAYKALLINRNFQEYNDKHYVCSNARTYFNAAKLALQLNDKAQAIELFTKAQASAQEKTSPDFIGLSALLVKQDDKKSLASVLDDVRNNFSTSSTKMRQMPLIIRDTQDQYFFVDNINNQFAHSMIALGNIQKLLSEVGIMASKNRVSPLYGYYPQLYRHIQQRFSALGMRVSAWDVTIAAIIKNELTALQNSLIQPLPIQPPVVPALLSANRYCFQRPAIDDSNQSMTTSMSSNTLL